MGAKVAITGATIWGNRGAEAMLVTTIGQVRAHDPSAQIVVLSYLPERDRALIEDPSIIIVDTRPLALVLGHFPFALLCGLFALIGVRLPGGILSKSVRQLRDCRVLIDVSGISFADGREKFLPFNILLALPTMLLRVPVVKLAQAVGPFEHPLTRLASNLFLKRCHRVYARGRITASYMESLGFPSEKWELSADTALLYDPAYSLSIENVDHVDALEAELKSIRDSGKTVIGLSPSSLVQEKSAKRGKDYAGNFIDLIAKLDDSYHYVLLPNATRQGVDKSRNNDLHVINTIYDRLQRDLAPDVAERVHPVNYDINTAGSRRLIACCDLVVTSRFHGMISCLSLGVPVVVIGWSHKYEEVLAEFDMAEFAIDFDDPKLDIRTRVEDILARRDALSQQIKTALVTVQARAQRQYDYVKEMLG